MQWRETLTPVRMERVAVLAPTEHKHAALIEVARSSAVELDLPYPPGDGPEEFDKAASAAVENGPVSGLVGWSPARRIPALREALAPLGAGVVPLKTPRGVQPPTLLTGNERPQRKAPRLSRLLVDTYTTIPYADVDPARLAGLAYVVMFGMMFGDAGQGLLLVLAGLLIRSGRIHRLRRFQKTWLFIFGAGLAAVFFGILYGEFFGPTHVIPVIWLEPVENPVPLLIAALVFGAVLLSGAYTVGTINRVREGGWAYAIYARTGLAGALLFLAVGLLAGGLVARVPGLIIAAAIMAAVAVVLIFTGLFVEAGGGATGTMQASVELVDTLIQLASNIVSFTRLAAFGITHAALLLIVWEATTALWHPDWRAVLAVLVFLVGNAITFALEGLVAAIQALRLEYYELFSRVFTDEGRPFKPWSPQLPDSVSSTGPTDSERQTP